MSAEPRAAPRPRESLRRRLDAVGPDAGATVMATGIVSIGLSLAGAETLSRVLLALGVVLWAAVAALAARQLVRSPRRFLELAGSPAALTAVAGTAVLGSRLLLLGWRTAAEAALAVAFCLWLGLVPLVLRAWSRPALGVSFMLAVSTESLAALAAGDAIVRRQEWLALAALVLVALGVAAYGAVLLRFDLRQVLVGLGDHWVAGGALAIATLAAADAARAAGAVGPLAAAHPALGDVALAVWCVAALWLPVLLAAEALRPRVRYDMRRWSTVFPLGMYAVASFVTGVDHSIGGLVEFARVWIWIALAVWAAVAGGLLLRGRGGGEAPDEGELRLQSDA